ncbi:MAG: ABA4-like family protein [Pseudomonadota bacterium]
MTLDQVFSATGTIAMIGWVILAVAPRRWPFLNALPRLIIPATLGLVYSAYIFAFFTLSGGGYGSLSEVRQLFTVDELLLAGWIHYLAFDLMIGAYLADRLDRVGISRWLQLPVLFTTLMFGPAGVILALGMEGAARGAPLSLRGSRRVSA